MYTRKDQNSGRVDMPGDFQMSLIDVAFFTRLVQQIGQ